MAFNEKRSIHDLGYLPADGSDYRDPEIGNTKLSDDPERRTRQAINLYKKFGDLRLLLYTRIMHLRQGLVLPPPLASFLEERVEEGETWSVKGRSGLSWQVLFDFVVERWPSTREDRERYMLRMQTMIDLVPHEVRLDASAVIAYHDWSRATHFFKSCVRGPYLHMVSNVELAGRCRKMDVRMGGIDGSLFVVNEDPEVQGVTVNMSSKFFETLRKRYFHHQ